MTVDGMGIKSHISNIKKLVRNWIGLVKTSLQLIPKVLKDLNLERVDVKSKFGRLIMWNCGVAHENSACKDTKPRLVLYVNYQIK